jgi:hypothetical protein
MDECTVNAIGQSWIMGLLGGCCSAAVMLFSSLQKIVRQIPVVFNVASLSLMQTTTSLDLRL